MLQTHWAFETINKQSRQTSCINVYSENEHEAKYTAIVQCLESHILRHKKKNKGNVVVMGVRDDDDEYIELLKKNRDLILVKVTNRSRLNDKLYIVGKFEAWNKEQSVLLGMDSLPIPVSYGVVHSHLMINPADSVLETYLRLVKLENESRSKGETK